MTTKKTRELIYKISLLKEEYSQKEFSDAMLFLNNNDLKSLIDKSIKQKEENKTLIKHEKRSNITRFKNKIKELPTDNAISSIRKEGVKLNPDFDKNKSFTETLSAFIELLSKKDNQAVNVIIDSIFTNDVENESYYKLASYMIKSGEKT